MQAVLGTSSNVEANARDANLVRLVLANRNGENISVEDDLISMYKKW